MDLRQQAEAVDADVGTTIAVSAEGEDTEVVNVVDIGAVNEVATEVDTAGNIGVSIGVSIEVNIEVNIEANTEVVRRTPAPFHDTYKQSNFQATGDEVGESGEAEMANTGVVDAGGAEV